MASLVGEQLKDTYDSLLKTSDNNALSGTYKEITDGAGNGSELYLGTGGNVGIGGTSANKKLYVLGDTTNYQILAEQPSGYAGLSIKSTTVAQTWSWIAQDNSSNSDLLLYGGASAGTKLTIDSSGNVGIGGSPGDGYRLQLLGDSEAGNTLGMTYLGVGASAIKVNSSGALEFGVDASDGSTERMRIDSSGNVGIGTSTVNAPLHIVGKNQTNGTAELTPDAAKGSYASFIHYGANGDWYIRSASASGNVYIQDTGGNVGIGTDSTNATLTVSSGTANNVANFKSTDGTAYIAIADDSSTSALHNQIGVIGDNMYFATNDQERMRILSGGGITFNGDTATANALDDYEEGTFDATIYEVGGSDILVEPSADYVKIGSLVHIQVRALGGTTGTSGVVRMNLPFTQTSKGGANIVAYSVNNGNIVSVSCIDGTNYLEFVDTIGSISSASKSIGSDWSSVSRLYFNFTYTTL